MNPWLYALLCILAPAVWGALMYVVFGWLRGRSQRAPRRERMPPADYTI